MERGFKGLYKGFKKDVEQLRFGIKCFAVAHFLSVSNEMQIGIKCFAALYTEKNPYLNNIIKAATIEKERLIGIFVDGDFFPG
ncbi:hypothetical protein GFV92_10590, partial [Salmonella enterica]|nr:hypothetical protein [Salmonella enterica]